MNGRSLDQQRAAHALERVDELQRDPKAAAKYVGYVKALPAAILANGLGQALATELAAKDDAHDALAGHVARWLFDAPGSRYKEKGDDSPGKELAKKMLSSIVEGSQRDYVWAQAEAIAYVGWLKKFAVAFLGKEQPSISEVSDSGR